MCADSSTSPPDSAPTRSSSRTFIYLALVAIAVLMIVQAQSSVESAVAWGGDLPAAFADAKSNDQPVLISFTSQGCIYCKRMEAEVIPQDAVLAEIGDMVPVKIDAFKDEAAALRYDVEGLPTYIITRSDGTPVLAASGFIPADDFLRFLRAGKTAARDAAP